MDQDNSTEITLPDHTVVTVDWVSKEIKVKNRDHGVNEKVSSSSKKVTIRLSYDPER